jgi:hypothetical protein
MSEITEHIIDCDADPFVPHGWEVVYHRKGGAFRWNKKAQKNAFYRENGKQIGGNRVHKVRSLRKPVLNANVLDDLLANTHLIPEEWEGQSTFFLGTIYCHWNGDFYARCLVKLCGRWGWSFGWPGYDWEGDNFVAVPAS